MGPSVLVHIPDEVADLRLVEILCAALGDHGWEAPEAAYERMVAELVRHRMGYVLLGDPDRQHPRGLAKRLLDHHRQRTRR